MPFNGSSFRFLVRATSRGFCPAAFSAFSLARGVAGIFLSPFVTVFAMGAALSSEGAGNRSCGEPRLKNVFAAVQNFGKARLAALNTQKDRVSFESTSPRQIGKEMAFAFNLASHRDAPVGLALAVCHPFAVIGLVISIVIDSINDKAFWALAHIRDEIRKIIPSRADRNSPSAIVFPLRALGIAASAPHTFPCGVKNVWVFEWHKFLLGKAGLYPLTAGGYHSI